VDQKSEQLFQRDSYLKEHKAKVLAVEDGAVVLDRSVFYPGGGGQPADEGKMLWLGYVGRIRKIKRSGHKILHWLSGPLPKPGHFVKCKLDWDRRYKLMRTHTALHILCGVIWRDFGAQVTGANMEPLKARMDFELESFNEETVRRVERAVNHEVAAARAIKVDVLPRDEAFRIPDLIRTKINLLPPNIQEVRIVEIVGLDLQADGGTHVANTSEVGTIKIVAWENKGRINKRLRIALVDEG